MNFLAASEALFPWRKVRFSLQMHLYCTIFHFSLFALNSDAYYAKIIPYDDGTMRISVVTTDKMAWLPAKHSRMCN